MRRKLDFKKICLCVFLLLTFLRFCRLLCNLLIIKSYYFFVEVKTCAYLRVHCKTFLHVNNFLSLEFFLK